MVPPAAPIAVLSDIHGNRWALEAVLADIARRGVVSAVNLGDSFYGPLDPAGTADLLLDRHIPAVCGNEDRLILQPPACPDHPSTLAFVRAQLTAAAIDWLSALALTRAIAPGVLMCHGTPDCDADYMLWDVGAQGARRRPVAAIEARLPAGDCRLLLCGHDHLPGAVRLGRGRARLVVDPGSVGLPAFVDHVPFVHAMAAGTPHARYCIVETAAGGGWEVEQIAVVYDWESAAAMAARNGRADWAAWLRTGRARV